MPGSDDARPVVIVGAAMFGRRMWTYLTADAGREVVAFAAEREHLRERELLGLPVVALDELPRSFDPSTHDACVALGHVGVNRARERLCGDVERLGYPLLSYRSTGATCWPTATVAERHVLVLDHAVVGPFSTVGENVILSSCHVNHDVEVGDHCFVGTGAVVGGAAVLGHHTFVGLGAVVLSGVRVAPRCVIGAGTVIKRDTAEGEVYSAQPSRTVSAKSWELRDPF